MKTSEKTVIGLVILGVTLLLNLGHAINNYGYGSDRFRLQIFASGSSGSSSSSSSSSSKTETDTSGREKIWKYRSVGCNGEWKGTASAEGCINPFKFFKTPICGFKINGEITYPYPGNKENCTGGDEWYDCNGAQSDCVITSSGTK